jgi:hypothetical protein
VALRHATITKNQKSTTINTPHLVESRGCRGNKKKEKQRSKSNFKTKEPASLKMKNLPLQRIAFGEKPKAFFSREYFPFFSFLFKI